LETESTVLGLAHWWDLVIVLAVALVGGAINAVAGGGTILTFPTLLALGVPPVNANTTNAVGLLPGSAGGAWGFRHEMAQASRWWFWLLIPSLIGGVFGAYLLVNLPSKIFASIAPYLVLLATVLIALQPLVERFLRLGSSSGHSLFQRGAAVLVLFVIAAYGGYFGASIGILMLTALGLVGMTDVAQANGMKNLLSIAIKGAAIIYFAFTGDVLWGIAIVMAVGAVIGGYAAGAIGHRIGEPVLRWVVVAIGIGVAIVMIIEIS